MLMLMLMREATRQTPADDRRALVPARFSPSARLRDRVESIDVVHGGPARLTVLPGAGAVLGVQFRGRVRGERGLLARAGVTGIQHGARSYEYIDGAASVLVRFTPQGAACLGVPASELVDQSVALEELVAPERIDALHERLARAPSDAARADAVAHLLEQLCFARDPAVTRAIALLDTEVSSVRALAAALGLSERQLERRFLAAVGVTPKRFAGLRRFERAVRLAQTEPTLAQAAVAAGYYDQSHLVRDFRRYAGASPTALLRSQPVGNAPAAGAPLDADWRRRNRP